MTHTTTLASAGTNYTAIGVLLAILVPICAAVAVIHDTYVAAAVAIETEEGPSQYAVRSDTTDP